MTQITTPDRSPVPPVPAAEIGAGIGQLHQLMTSALDAWSAYWAACFAARGMSDLYRANAELAAQGLSLADHAAAERQRVHGAVAPTLNDA